MSHREKSDKPNNFMNITTKYKQGTRIQVTSYDLELMEGVIHCRICVPYSGKSPGVLFFSGFPGYQRNFDLAFELALSGLATCTFDYPGVWRSKGSFSPLIGVRVAKKVKEFFLGKLSSALGNWGIFGHSWGATLALLYGSQDPSCKSIAALSPVNDLLSITKGTRESVFEMFINDATPLRIKIDQKRLEADLDIIASRNILKNVVQQISQPVLLLHGSEDQEVSPSQSQQISELSKSKFKLQLLPNEGHNPKNRENLLSILLEWYTSTLK